MRYGLLSPEAVHVRRRVRPLRLYRLLDLAAPRRRRTADAAT